MTFIFGTNKSDFISPNSVSAGVSGIMLRHDASFVFGGNGDDRITGGRGSDVIHGGNGNDRIGGPFNLDLGSIAPDLLYGDNGDDILVGNWGPDSLFGGNGNDRLVGGNNHRGGAIDEDFLSGGKGDDWLDGAFGSDTLSGGPGDDTFYFSMGYRGPALGSTSLLGEGNRDVILDFQQGEDVIDLSEYHAAFAFLNGSLDPQFPDPPQFLGTGAFNNEYQGLQVRYDIAGEHTIVEFRSAVNPDRSPETWWTSPTLGEIDLVGVHPLTANDFILMYNDSILI